MNVNVGRNCKCMKMVYIDEYVQNLNVKITFELMFWFIRLVFFLRDISNVMM